MLKKEAPVRKSGFVFLVTLLLTQFSMAEVFMKQRVTQSGIMGQPGGTQVHDMWISNEKVRTDMGTQSIIMDMKKNSLIMLNHTEQTVTEMPMDMSKIAEAQMGDEGAEGAADMQQMMQNMMKMTMTVTPTQEKKKIGQWKCTKYLQTLQTAMGTISTEVWATEEIKVDMEVYKKSSMAMLKRQPGMGASMEEMMKELKKIKGVNVLQKASGQMMGMNFESTTELLEVREAKAPIGTFTAPVAYNQKKM